MKIAFFSTLAGETPWGGSEELWCQTAGLALERGHQLAVVNYRWPQVPRKISELQERGAWLLRLPHPREAAHARDFHSRLKRKWDRFRAWSSLASWKPEVVCVSQAGTFDMVPHGAITGFANEHSVPYVVICHHNCEDLSFINEATRHAAIGFFSRARNVAFVAQRNLRVVERQIATHLADVCVIRNPVNLANLNPVPYPNSDLVKMANVARAEAQCKGQDVLLETLSEGIWKQRRWLLRFYGDGVDRPYLERLTGHYGLADKVEFCGHIGDVRSIWADNHLLVMPSRSEGTPLSLVEAMICGRPSVVTDVGGHTEWVNEPSIGFVAEAPSASSLNKALERAWEARERWESIGQHAREVALTKIDPHPDESLLSLLVCDRARHGFPRAT
jgi:glycosyltransferase involved in cell wall biosynthesis